MAEKIKLQRKMSSRDVQILTNYQFGSTMSNKQREIFFDIYDYNRKLDVYILVNEKRLIEIPAELTG